MIPGGKDSPWKDDGSAILPDSPDLFFVPQTETKRKGDQEMIKRTYLVRDESSSIPALKKITGKEWHEITEKNKSLPPQSKRYFIVDTICDGEKIDVMYMETSLEDYTRWHSENTIMLEKRRIVNEKDFLSLDVEPESIDYSDVSKALVDRNEMEKPVLNTLAVAALKKRVASWEPWAGDLLEYYLKGEKRTCTKPLARKYGVCDFTVRRWKKEFEKRCKKFFEKI